MDHFFFKWKESCWIKVYRSIWMIENEVLKKTYFATKIRFRVALFPPLVNTWNKKMLHKTYSKLCLFLKKSSFGGISAKKTFLLNNFLRFHHHILLFFKNKKILTSLWPWRIFFFVSSVFQNSYESINFYSAGFLNIALIVTLIVLINKQCQNSWLLIWWIIIC